MAPSVVTVINQKEIEKRGYRTIHDALPRVPGFFPAVAGQAWELVSNRGFVQDQNYNY
jgi:outer membrane receptor for ferrienterochelin and colicin